MFYYLDKKQLYDDYFNIYIYYLKYNIFILNKNLFFINYRLNNLLLNIPNFICNDFFFGRFLDFEIKSYNNNKKYLLSFRKKIINNDIISPINICGNGFVVLKNNYVKLFRSLTDYMLNIHVNIYKYMEISSPLMVNIKSMFNSGHFPKFINEQYSIKNSNLWLIPTSEVILINMLDFFKNNLKFPMKLVTKSHCFRKENDVGCNNKLFRHKQFEKIELVNVVKQTSSYYFLYMLVENICNILKKLNLSYRIIELSSFNLGFTSSKTYDIEIWLPKSNKYVEVSSCSNTESFQSRRLNVKYKNNFIHLLNGSGLALDRILLSIIENYSSNNGILYIPKVLRKYFKNFFI